MNPLGNLMVIWGAAVPAMVLPWTQPHPAPFGLVDALVRRTLWVFDVDVPYGGILTLSLLCVACGLTLNTLTAARPPRR